VTTGDASLMPEYLVELYLANSSSAPLEAPRRARSSANAMRREGQQVRYLRSIFVPEDETCFLLFEAASPDLVGEASRRAALTYDRIVEAVGDASRTREFSE
jgi:hypothetical protein